MIAAHAPSALRAGRQRALNRDTATFDRDGYQSWQDAENHPNDDGTSQYVVRFTNGNTVAGTRLDDIPEQGNLWYGRWTTASHAAPDFYDNMPMCTLGTATRP